MRVCEIKTVRPILYSPPCTAGQSKMCFNLGMVTVNQIFGALLFSRKLSCQELKNRLSGSQIEHDD